MTRDDDVMEIGGHSGSKTWSLKCVESQWIGAVGQCGEMPGESYMIFKKGNYQDHIEMITMHVMSLSEYWLKYSITL